MSKRHEQTFQRKTTDNSHMKRLPSPSVNKEIEL